MFDPGPCVYMDKIAVGPEAADVDRHQRAGEGQPRSGRQGARRRRRRHHRGDPRPSPSRGHHPRVPRSRCPHPAHPGRRRRRRDLGGHGRRASANILFGIGGTPEGVIAACRARRPSAARCRDACGRATTTSAAPRSTPATTSTACSPPTISCGAKTCSSRATGITDGELLKGVRYWGDGASTQSLVMRSKSGTIRTIDATHKWQKLMRYSAFKFD